MSKRKRYRKLRAGVVKNNLALFAKNRRKHRDERQAEDAKEQLGRARLMYETFKTELSSEARTPAQVIAALEALKDAIKKVVKNKHARVVMLQEINFSELKFLAAYGPTSKAQIKQWREEARGVARESLPRSVRPTEMPPGEDDPARN